MAPTPDREIVIDPPTPEARRLWAKTIELAQVFGTTTNWSLVGGLMVQLHGFEYGGEVRPTVDIDVLGDSRQRPAATSRIAETLAQLGGQMLLPSRSAKDLGYKFDLDGELVEVLGSDGVDDDPQTLGKYRTFQVPGGTQALRRTEPVFVSLDGGPPVQMRRPSLLGAILIKARVAAKRRKKFESDRQDLIRLLSFVEDPRALALEGCLKNTEKGWLRKVEVPLGFNDPQLSALFPTGVLSRAEQTLALLIG